MHPTVAKYYNTAEGLTDQELDFLINLYKRLSDDLNLLGEKFSLAWLPIYMDLIKFEGYKRARQEKH